MLAVALLTDNMAIAITMAALTGACIGFMPYNLNPAKIFMGDTGSTFLGYMLATVSIMGLFKFYAVISFAVPFLILGLPIFDTANAIIRRLAEGRSPMSPDRGHVHHKLIDMGFNQKQAVAILYAISATLGLTAVVLTSSGEVKAVVLLAAVLAAILVGACIIYGAEHWGKSIRRSRKNTKTRLHRRRKTNMNKIKVMTVFGTRPEAIKMAPLVHALEQNENTESIVCVTAQHREMLDQVLDIFGIRPDYDLNIMQPRQTLATITEKSLHGLDEVLEKAQPDIVLVHGDTSTTFAGALAAFYHKIPVGHVEAGLRTYDKYSPFPEEMNRKLTGQIATLHFAPTPRNRDNLAREGHH